ncbi:hypothetical protein [Salsipaludibacter albus]|uniref:hypothetical protein n=1 Tax=Salsipaludibacter albus TaxID=2849650 RepID=UPI001EE4D1E5|nr:hypothetical protein [Salsipaludibacter albus]MBY5162933.1 hypothetical protein [Salsipaludibacter albus]
MPTEHHHRRDGRRPTGIPTTPPATPPTTPPADRPRTASAPASPPATARRRTNLSLPRRLVLAATVLAVTLTLAGCSRSGRLPTLAAEPILTQPPGATELDRTEIAGSTFGFGTPARVEVVWGVDDVDDTTDWYLDEFGEVYGLELNTPGTFYGTRRADDIGIRAGLTVAPSIGEVGPGMAADPDDLPDWSGPVAVARVASD